MSYLVLARKYRPQTFEQVVGQTHVTRTLTNAVSSNRVAHAILFSGPRGTGKTTVARILAKAMNCEQGPTPTPCNQCRSCREITDGHSADVFEIDGASNNSVDQVRELRDNVKYMPSYSPYKIYIIDEVHMLSIAAFNALLKTLEEPPAHILFFFATTEPHKIPITILSRCQRYDFRRIATEPILNHLQMLCSKEDIQIPEESLRLIAREAAGSMRDSLSLLDQVMACSQGEITHDQVIDTLGAFDTNVFFSVSDAIRRGDVPQLLTLLDDLYNNGRDLKKFFNDLVCHFRNMLVVKLTKNTNDLVDLSSDEIETIRKQVADRSVSDLEQTLDLFAREETSVRLSIQPKLAMEMALVRLARLKPVLAIETLIERLDVLRQDLSGGPLRNDTPSNSDRLDGGIEKVPPVVREKPAAYETTAPSGSRNEDSQVTPEKSPLQDLSAIWESVLKEIKRKHPSLAPHYSNSALLRVDSDSLEIEVNGKPFSLSRIKQPKNIDILKRVCGKVMGRDVTVRIVEKPSETEDTAAAKKRENQIKAEAVGHPLVNDVVEVFDAKVVDVKIL